MARELQAREKEKKEQELRELAMRARAERGGAGAYAPPPAAARYQHLAVSQSGHDLHQTRISHLCLLPVTQLQFRVQASLSICYSVASQSATLITPS